MDSLSFLAKDAPGFAVRGSQVKILTQPSQFYDDLCKRASLADNRIVMVNQALSWFMGGRIKRENMSLVKCTYSIVSTDPLNNSLTAYKMTSQISILALLWDQKTQLYTTFKVKKNFV